MFGHGEGNGKSGGRMGERETEWTREGRGKGANANKTQLAALPGRPISGCRGTAYTRVKPARHYLRPGWHVLLAGFSLFFAISRAPSRGNPWMSTLSFSTSPPRLVLENADLDVHDVFRSREGEDCLAFRAESAWVSMGTRKS